MAEPIPSDEPTGLRRPWVKVVAVLALLAVVLVVLAEVLPALTEQFAADQDGDVLGDVVKGWSATVLHPAYWAFLGVLFVAEWRWPAREGEGLASIGAAQDLAWLLLFPLFSLTIVAAYVNALHRLYEGPLGGAALDVDGTLGAPVAFVLAFLLADFFMWFSHFVRHKILPLWRFHQVHHSQRSLSALTDNRVHFFEAMVSATLAYLPARLLGLSDEAAALVAFATVFFTGFTHANLRTDLGPLRHVLVTPQSHRVHHSTEEQHWDHNFGAVLSIWDHIFGTQWKGYDDYPTVGIDDEGFPVERSARITSVLGTYARQVAYPFTKVARDLRARIRPAGGMAVD